MATPAPGDDARSGSAGRVSQRRNLMDRFIESIEWIAAFFVGVVALNTFTAIVLRKFFSVTIPDYYISPVPFCSLFRSFSPLG